MLLISSGWKRRKRQRKGNQFMSLQLDPEEHEIDALVALLPNLHSSRVVEVGCGDGRLTRRYAARDAAPRASDAGIDGRGDNGHPPARTGREVQENGPDDASSGAPMRRHRIGRRDKSNARKRDAYCDSAVLKQVRRLETSKVISEEGERDERQQRLQN
jgi:hypothetical protein